MNLAAASDWVQLFGRDVHKNDLVSLGVVVVLAIIAMLGLARYARYLQSRGLRGGMAFFTGLVYVPIVAALAAMTVLGWHRVVVTEADPVAGSHAVYGNRYGHTNVLILLVVVLGVYLGLSLLDSVLFTRERERRFGWKVPRILRDSIRWTAMIATTIFTAIGLWADFGFGDFTLLTGFVSVALSFALGPTLGSLVSGFTLTTERPFELGDWIEVGAAGDARQGRVDQITWRSTRIITRDNESVVFSNGRLAEERIVNLSRPDVRLGVRVRVGVHYRTPPHQVREALRLAAYGAPGVLRTPEPAIRLVEYGDSAINWEMRFWINEAEKLEEIRADVMQRIWYHFERGAIEIPFPIRNLIMREPKWEEQRPLSTEEKAERRHRDLRLLKQVPIFGPPPEEQQRFLADRLGEQVYLEGERIAAQGDPGDRMFIIIEGRARVTIDVEGTQEIGELVTGEFFGEMSLLTGSPRVATVTASTFLRVLTLRAQDLAPVLRSHPQFAEDMASFAAARKVELQELSDRVRKEKSEADFETTSSNLLADIWHFFGLPGRRSGGSEPS